jgi:hypothetical protein
LEHPELRARPFAVLDGEAPEEFVFAANKAARVWEQKLLMVANTNPSSDRALRDR